MREQSVKFARVLKCDFLIKHKSYFVTAAVAAVVAVAVAVAGVGPEVLAVGSGLKLSRPSKQKNKLII